MRKASKIMLLVWDILLIPVFVTVILTVCGAYPSSGEIMSMPRILTLTISLCEFVTFFLAAFSQLLIPQVISLVLVTLNLAMPFRFWEPTPTRKEIIRIIILSILAIAGAVCSYIALAMMAAGERGAPIS